MDRTVWQDVAAARLAFKEAKQALEAAEEKAREVVAAPKDSCCVCGARGAKVVSSKLYSDAWLCQKCKDAQERFWDGRVFHKNSGGAFFANTSEAVHPVATVSLRKVALAAVMDGAFNSEAEAEFALRQIGPRPRRGFVYGVERPMDGNRIHRRRHEWQSLHVDHIYRRRGR